MTARLWTMWLCASLFYAYQYVLRVIPNVLKTDLDCVFNFDAVLFGQFAGIYYVGYTLAHIPLGLLLDRFGPKWILPLATLISCLGMTPLLWADNFIYAIIGRFFLGLGSSCAFIGLVKVVHIAFDANKFYRMLSFGSIFGLVGGMFAGAPIHYLMQFFGWKSIIWVSILIGSFLSVILFLVIPKQTEQKASSSFKILKDIFSNKWVWIVAFGAGLMVGPLEGYADAWAVQSLKTLYNIPDTLASQSVSIIYLGFALGLPGLSFLSDRIGLDKTIILSGIFMILSFLTIMSGEVSIFIAISAMLILGFFSAFQVPALCRATTFTPPFATSLTTALANTVVMLFGMFFHTILGGCVSYFSVGTPLIDGTITSQCHSIGYQKSFIIIPIMLLLGTCIFIYINARFKEKNEHQ